MQFLRPEWNYLDMLKWNISTNVVTSKVLILLLQLPEPPVRGLRQVREQRELREEGREVPTEKRESIDG